MPDIPQDAQRSEDGQWWWDGSQWQPVGGGSDQTATTGTQSDVKVKIEDFTALAHTENGITMMICQGSVTNHSGRPLEYHEFTLMIGTMPESSQPEKAATFEMGIGALRDGETKEFRAPIQVDDGKWSVTADIWSGGKPISGTHTPEIVVDVGSGVAKPYVHLDDSVKLDLGVEITNVTHEGGALYRIHYVVQNNSAPVKPGLVVQGSLKSEQSSMYAQQSYAIPEPLPQGRSRDHYLTLEADAVQGPMVASITLDAIGPNLVEALADVVRDESGAVTSVQAR
jgi:hypothetical protein